MNTNLNSLVPSEQMLKIGDDKIANYYLEEEKCS